MSPNNFEKGPCKWFTLSFFRSGSLSSLVWSGRIPKSETVGNQDELEHKYEVTPALIGVVDKHEHTRRRRPWTRGFSTSALKGYEELVIKRTLQLVEALASQNLKDTVDISKWVEFFGYATIIPFILHSTELSLLFCSYDVMNDIACVERQANRHFNLLVISSTVLVVAPR